MTKAPTATYVHFLRLVEANDDRMTTSYFTHHLKKAIRQNHVYTSKLLGGLKLTPNGEQILAMYGSKAQPIKKKGEQ